MDAKIQDNSLVINEINLTELSLSELCFINLTANPENYLLLFTHFDIHDLVSGDSLMNYLESFSRVNNMLKLINFKCNLSVDYLNFYELNEFCFQYSDVDCITQFINNYGCNNKNDLLSINYKNEPGCMSDYLLHCYLIGYQIFRRNFFGNIENDVHLLWNKLRNLTVKFFHYYCFIFELSEKPLIIKAMVNNSYSQTVISNGKMKRDNYLVNLIRKKAISSDKQMSFNSLNKLLISILEDDIKYINNLKSKKSNKIKLYDGIKTINDFIEKCKQPKNHCRVKIIFNELLQINSANQKDLEIINMFFNKFKWGENY